MLNVLHQRTDAIPLDADGAVDVTNPISRITYLDDSGDPIAAESYEESSGRSRWMGCPCCRRTRPFEDWL